MGLVDDKGCSCEEEVVEQPHDWPNGYTSPYGPSDNLGYS